jgi:hypothetical protein
MKFERSRGFFWQRLIAERDRAAILEGQRRKLLDQIGQRSSGIGLPNDRARSPLQIDENGKHAEQADV